MAINPNKTSRAMVLELPLELNKKVKIYAIKNNHKKLSLCVLEILREKLGADYE